MARLQSKEKIFTNSTTGTYLKLNMYSPFSVSQCTNKYNKLEACEAVNRYGFSNTESSEVKQNKSIHRPTR